MISGAFLGLSRSKGLDDASERSRCGASAPRTTSSTVTGSSAAPTDGGDSDVNGGGDLTSDGGEKGLPPVCGDGDGEFRTNPEVALLAGCEEIGGNLVLSGTVDHYARGRRRSSRSPALSRLSPRPRPNPRPRADALEACLVGSASLMKPIQTAIESLQAKGLCPRLHVDVTHEDAVVPDFVRDKWKERLVIDLDPSYPLDLAFTEVGVEADLSFGGYVTRCTFPWAAIYVVADRGTGRGQVFARNIPDSLRHEYGAPAPQVPALDPELAQDPRRHQAQDGLASPQACRGRVACQPAPGRASARAGPRAGRGRERGRGDARRGRGRRGRRVRRAGGTEAPVRVQGDRRRELISRGRGSGGSSAVARRASCGAGPRAHGLGAVVEAHQQVDPVPGDAVGIDVWRRGGSVRIGGEAGEDRPD
jgi:stringent starvation protein B